jgi:hypothetical protein
MPAARGVGTRGETAASPEGSASNALDARRVAEGLAALHYFTVHNITWRALLAGSGSWNSIWKRFWRLSRSGVYEIFFEALASLSERAHLVQMFDKTVIRAHVPAAGAKGGRMAKPPGAPGAVSRPKSISRPVSKAIRRQFHWVVGGGGACVLAISPACLLGADKGPEAATARTVIIKSRRAAFGKTLPPVQHGRAGCLSSLARALFALPEPEPAPSTIRARGAMRCSVLPGRASRAKLALSSAVISRAALLAPMPRGMTPATFIVKRYMRH